MFFQYYSNQINILVPSDAQRKSKWGEKSSTVAPVGMAALPQVGVAGSLPPVGLIQPELSIGANNKITHFSRTNPSMIQYAMKVFGTAQLSDDQWQQCEDQVKVQCDQNITYLLIPATFVLPQS